MHRTEERSLQQLLNRSEIELAEVREALDDALKLVETPLETYLAASDLGKRLLNQVFFSEIRVGEDGEVQAASIEPPYARIIAPRLVRRQDTDPANPGHKRPNPDPYSLGPGFDLEKIGAP